MEVQRSRVCVHLCSVGEEGEVELLASVRGSIHFGQHSVLIIIIIIIIIVIIVNPFWPTLTLTVSQCTQMINRILFPSTSRSRRGPFYNPQHIFTQNPSCYTLLLSLPPALLASIEVLYSIEVLKIDCHAGQHQCKTFEKNVKTRPQVEKKGL